jgi:CRISPR system Cascade subunit CasD
MPEHILLRLQAPLMAFGGEAIDQRGVIRDVPAASMLTGLLGNALGWSRTDTALLDGLQDRLVFAVRVDRPGSRVQDFQTAQLAKSDRGWTTRGAPEGRAGGGETYRAPHLRYRDYHADAAVTVALRLDPGDGELTLETLVAALNEPERPLFFGRKPCLPCGPIVIGRASAESALGAVIGAPALDDDAPDRRLRLFWGDDEDASLPREATRHHRITLCDRRNWRTGAHGGWRTVHEGSVERHVADHRP